MPLQKLGIVVDDDDRDAGALDLLHLRLGGLVAPIGHQEHIGFEPDDLLGAEAVVLGEADIGHHREIGDHSLVAVEDQRPPAFPGRARDADDLLPGLDAADRRELLEIEVHDDALHRQVDLDLAPERVGDFGRGSEHRDGRGDEGEGAERE